MPRRNSSYPFAFFSQSLLRTDQKTAPAGMADILKYFKFSVYICECVEFTEFHTLPASVTSLWINGRHHNSYLLFSIPGWFEKEMSVRFFNIAVCIYSICCRRCQIDRKQSFPCPAFSAQYSYFDVLSRHVREIRHGSLPGV